MIFQVMDIYTQSDISISPDFFLLLHLVSVQVPNK